MRRLIIVYDKYLDEIEKKLTLGGIQTYITNLCKVGIKAGLIPYVVQDSREPFCYEKMGVTICGIGKGKEKLRKRLVLYCEDKFDFNTDILVFASYIFFHSSKFNCTINIQHGVSWDIPIESTGIKRLADCYRRANQIYGVMSKVGKSDYTVCVDYNFINWYRTKVNRIDNKMIVIPNFTEARDYLEKNNERIKILFARRFWYYRGTRLFAEVISKIIKDYDVEVVFAGEGPDEQWLKNKFMNMDNVSFIRYESEDSLNVHTDYDIAVVPTLGSEGTSLSLLEAMSASCAVIATNVGGMTNIVIDGFNGILINPDEKELIEAIKILVIDKEYRQKLARKGNDTVREGFSYDIWERKWMDLFLACKR